MRQAISQEELGAVGAALRQAEWGVLKGPEVPKRGVSSLCESVDEDEL